MLWVYGVYYASNENEKAKELSANDAERYREELAKLPIGSLSRKTIAGKVDTTAIHTCMTSISVSLCRK